MFIGTQTFKKKSFTHVALIFFPSLNKALTLKMQAFFVIFIHSALIDKFISTILFLFYLFFQNLF